MNINDMILLSIDDHIIESPTTFDNHMPAKYKDQAPKLIKDPDNPAIDRWEFQGTASFTGGLGAVVSWPKEEWGFEPTGLAEMRPGTTYMDIDYRVDDPDDATVRVRALAFVNGTRSFANILRPVSFVEGTAGNLGDSIRSGTKQTLTWNVGADWNTDLGQMKFEILALDSRGHLPIDWVTIPAASGQPALTISEDRETTPKARVPASQA
jgi:hypothetical protein